MIQHLKTLPPFISFGFNAQQRQTTAGTATTVWLNTLYNRHEYTFTLAAPGAAVHKISNYEYVLTYTTPGSYSIYLTVNGTSKNISLNSNILTLTVT